MGDAPPGSSATAGTSRVGLCPSCNTSRIGNFRFCLSCLQDFDQGSPRGLSDASLGMARARSAEMAIAFMASLGMAGGSVASPPTAPASVARAAIAAAPSPAGPWSTTPPAAEAAAVAPTAEAAAVAPAVHPFTLAPAHSLTEPRSATIDRLIYSLETRVERGTRVEPMTVPDAERVPPLPTRRGIPRRLGLVVAAIAIALVSVSALAIVLGR